MSRHAWTLLLLVTMVTPGLMVLAADEPAAPGPAAKKAEPAKGRLPMYYARVVDDAQRAKIYSIQAEYAEKIEALAEQLRDLMSERDAKIAAVLTPQQLQAVRDLADEAKAKARSRVGGVKAE